MFFLINYYVYLLLVILLLKKVFNNILDSNECHGIIGDRTQIVGMQNQSFTS